MGRTRKLFSYQYYDIIPDILTLAKSLGGGFPISAMLTTNKVGSVIKTGIHGTTYGGNSLACAVEESVINIINTKKFLSGVKKKFKRIISELNIFNKHFKLFTEIRGQGLLIDVVLKSNFSCKINETLNLSFLAGVIFFTAVGNVIRLASSLIIREYDIVEGMKRFYLFLEKC